MLRGYKRLLALSALMSGASPVEDTATGNPLTFLTDLAKPLKSLVIPFSDENGVTGLSVWHGKSIYDSSNNEKGFITSNGTVSPNDLWEHSELIPVNGHSTLYYFGITTPGASPYSAWYKQDGTFLSSFKQQTGKNTLTVPDNAYYVAFSLLQQESINVDDIHDFKLFYFNEISETSAIFPVEAGSPTEGQLDIISGVLTVTAPTAGTYQLTPQQITALVGNNTIWSDADGQLTAVYLKKA